MRRAVDVVAAVGVALGGILGIAGTMVGSPVLRASCWAVDGVGLVVATALLAVRYLRRGNDSVAAGFIVFAIGEGVMLSGTATTLTAALPSFAAGTALWAAALLLISLPKGFLLWVRITGTVGAILFAITAARIFTGAEVLPTSSPLPQFAYPFLVLTFIGWIWEILKRE